MPSGRYRFVRKSNSAEGFVSTNRPSTDALNVVIIWSNAQPQRSYTVLIDEDEQLVANLTWSETDPSAGPSLDGACDKFGIERSYVQT